jgi:hypothetical protein
MTPAQIRDYAVSASMGKGINPAITLGLIEHVSSFATKHDKAGKLGLMSVPADEVQDKAAYLANPKAQIDSGIIRLLALKGDGTDIDGMIAYTGDAKTSMKALLRGLKTTTEPVAKEVLEAAYSLTGSRGSLEQDAKKYGFEFETIKPPQRQPKAATQYQDSVQVEEPDPFAPESTEDLAEMAFSSHPKNSTPPDVMKQIEAIGKE